MVMAKKETKRGTPRRKKRENGSHKKEVAAATIGADIPRQPGRSRPGGKIGEQSGPPARMHAIDSDEGATRQETRGPVGPE
jgi:hypothetical protein